MPALQDRQPNSPGIPTRLDMAHLCTLRGNGTVSVGARRVSDVAYVIMVARNRPDGRKRGRGTLDASLYDLYRIFLAKQPSLMLQCGGIVGFKITQLTLTRQAPPFCEIVTIGELPEICSPDPANPDGP